MLATVRAIYQSVIGTVKKVWNWLTNSITGKLVISAVNGVCAWGVYAFAWAHATIVPLTTTEGVKTVTIMIVKSTLPIWGQWVVAILWYTFIFFCVWYLVEGILNLFGISC